VLAVTTVVVALLASAAMLAVFFIMRRRPAGSSDTDSSKHSDALGSFGDGLGHPGDGPLLPGSPDSGSTHHSHAVVYTRSGSREAGVQAATGMLGDLEAGSGLYIPLGGLRQHPQSYKGALPLGPDIAAAPHQYAVVSGVTPGVTARVTIVCLMVPSHHQCCVLG
jgi:hypothetical protein